MWKCEKKCGKVNQKGDTHYLGVAFFISRTYYFFCNLKKNCNFFTILLKSEQCQIHQILESKS